MATKRRSLEQRINDRVAKLKAAQDELRKLQLIREMAELRSEWVDEQYAKYCIEPVEKDPDEELRLGLLAETMGTGGGIDAVAVEALEKARREAEEKAAELDRFVDRLSTAVSHMAGDLGIHGENVNDVWAQVKQRYGIQ